MRWCSFHVIAKVIHVVRLFVLWLSVPHLVLSMSFSYPLFYLNFEFNLFVHVAVIRGTKPLAVRQRRSLVPWPKTPSHRSWVQHPWRLSLPQRLLKSSSRGNPATRCPRTCLTWNSATRPSAECSLHHCSPRSEKNQRIEDKHITLMKKGCCKLSLGLSVMQDRGDPCMNLVLKFTQQRETESRNGKRNNQNSLWTTKIANSQKFWSRDSQTRVPSRFWWRSIHKLNGVIESQRGEIKRAHAGDEHFRRNHQLLRVKLLEQNRELREPHEKSHMKMEEL